mmetsp:Transcript_3360/g.10545  ORF Transcript_3360/g.10545 Transcript_3360/m.10545 type:complete len:487 (+) Transcript_3360:1887-3347(+)
MRPATTRTSGRSACPRTHSPHSRRRAWTTKMPFAAWASASATRYWPRAAASQRWKCSAHSAVGTWTTRRCCVTAAWSRQCSARVWTRVDACVGGGRTCICLHTRGIAYTSLPHTRSPAQDRNRAIFALSPSLLVRHGRRIEADGREGLREALHLGSQLPHLRQIGLLEVGQEVLELAAGRLLLGLGRDLHAARQQLRHALKVALHQAARGQRGGAQAQAGGDERAAVAGDGVLVGADVGKLQHALRASAVHTLAAEVQQHQVVVGASRHDVEAAALQRAAECLRVLQDLLLVRAELGCLGHLERGGQCGDGVVVRAALQTGEDGEVDALLQVVLGLSPLGIHRTDALAIEDHGPTRPAQGLVRGGRDHVRVLEGRRDDARSHQARDVGHVRQQVRARAVGHLAHALVVVQPRVGGGAGDEDLGTEQLRGAGHGVVVDQARRLVQPVRHALKVDGHGADLLGGRLVAVGEVSAVRQIQREDALMWLE